MIRQATVQDIRRQGINKLHGDVILITRYYPRNLKRRLISEYFPILAPSIELLREFKVEEEKLGDHDGALESIDYEAKFQLVPEALTLLKQLVEQSEHKTLYLVCHCRVGERCHRELVLLLAQQLFGAKISKLSFGWEKFRSRVANGEFTTLVV